MAKFNANQLLWIDFETDGFDPKTLNILEVSVILTDKDLNVIDELPNLNVYRSTEFLESMDEWCATTHRGNGVSARCEASEWSLDDVKNKLVNFLNKHQINNTAYLAGSGVHYDKAILEHTWPDVLRRFPYRILDITSFYIASTWWREDVICANADVLKGDHSSYGDLKASIAYMRNYKAMCFTPPSSGVIITQ